MAFLENSRYFDLETVDSVDAGGRPVKAVKLRRLPTVESAGAVVEERDRVDTLALSNYEDGTKFWHVADANSELEAETLTATPGRTILLPK